MLTVRLDAQCAATRVVSADVFIDGQYVNVVASGGSHAQTVTIGTHFVEAAAYYPSGAVAFKWGPEIVNVPAAGFSELFYCR